MASEARAQRRRASRSEAAKKAAATRKANAAAKANGVPEAPPQLAVVVTISRTEDGGFTIEQIVPHGDVRPGEIGTVLEKGVKVFRDRAGLD